MPFTPEVLVAPPPGTGGAGGAVALGGEDPGKHPPLPAAAATAAGVVDPEPNTPEKKSFNELNVAVPTPTDAVAAE
jgi:hypothetical protein